MNSRSASGIGVSYDMSNNMMLRTINIVVVLACLAGAYYFWTDTNEFLETSEITDGEIIRFNESVRDGTTHYTAVVRFSTASGREVEFWSNTSSSNPSQIVGDRVEVIYHPDSPENARLNTFFGLYGFTTILGLLGVFGIAFFAGNQIQLNKKKAHAEHLAMFGKAIETEFTGVKSRRRGNSKTTSYIITSKVVTDGITRQFKSEELRRDPSLYTDIPNTITVVVDPNSPSQYAMDISFLPDDVFKPLFRISSGNSRLSV